MDGRLMMRKNGLFTYYKLMNHDLAHLGICPKQELMLIQYIMDFDRLRKGGARSMADIH